jgi:hypothetical protein
MGYTDRWEVVPEWSTFRARGSLSNPLPVQDGDYLGGYTIHGYNGSQFLQVAGIIGKVDGPLSGGYIPSKLEFLTAPVGGAVTTRMVINQAGNVGIGTTTPNHLLTVGSVGMPTSTYALGVYGSIRATGEISANQSFDIAEAYPIDPECENKENCPQAGDVVSIKENLILEKSSIPYDPKIIGVITQNPAFSMGTFEMSTSSRLVALSGRVKVKVSTENGKIKPGDLLTSGSLTPGVAIRATEPGRVIGIALEEFEEDGKIGEIMVFVNPHFALGQISEDGLIYSKEEIYQKEIQPASVLDQFTLAIKKSLEKLGLILQDGIAKVKEMLAEKVVTKQICLQGDDGETICIDKNQLKELLEKTTTQTIQENSEKSK